MRIRTATCIATLALLSQIAIPGCGSNNPSAVGTGGSPAPAATGGTVSTGGTPVAPATGGSSATGGAAPATGGIIASGGTTSAPATGGAAPATGGTIATGGAAPATGGTVATGGTTVAPNTGGTAATGGTTASGDGGAPNPTDASGTYQTLCKGLTTAAGPEPTKGGLCSAADTQLCYKTCGPKSIGFKSETCTGGSYQEQTG